MKKNLISSAVLALSLTTVFSGMSALSAQASSSDVALTAENFPDPYLREELSYYDDDYDDVLSSDEIRNITELYLYNCDITDLTGIEYLTSLETLDCGSNNFKTLHFKNLPALKYLCCSDNSLTDFSVSNCPKLKEIDCSSNKLTELNLSSNTTVQRLDCYDNKLTELDLSGCTSLTYVDYSENKITDINLSECTSLDDFSIYDDILITANFTGCSSLIQLDCYGSNLSTIILTGCSSLESLSCYGDLNSLNLKDCISLEELNVSNNRLSSLDLSNCTNLRAAYCDSNKISSLTVKNCSKLNTLYCMGNKLTTIDFSGCSSLKELDCSDNQLTSINLSSCKSIKNVWCTGNSRKVSVTSKNLFDLTSLTGFNSKKADFWYGAEVTGDFITFTDEEAWYSYDTGAVDTKGDAIIADFTLIPVVDPDLTIKIPLSKPVLKSISNVNGGVKLKWESTKNAAKYRIYRKNADGEWKKLKDVTSLSYTDKTVESGKNYTYTVRAYNGDSKSSYDSTGIKIKYLSMPSLKSLSNVSTGSKLTWGKVSGASKYRIYRKTADESWKKLADVTSTSYTDKTVKSGKKYTYTVRALKDSYSSAYNTTGKTTKYLSVPTLNKLKKANGGIQISWKKVSGASKYVIYKKNSDGEWKKLKTVTSLNYTDTSIKKGKTYSYTVRAYSGDYKSSYNSKGVSLKY